MTTHAIAPRAWIAVRACRNLGSLSALGCPTTRLQFAAWPMPQALGSSRAASRRGLGERQDQAVAVAKNELTLTVDSILRSVDDLGAATS